MIAPIVQGSKRRITVNFANSNGIAKNPTSAVLRIKSPTSTADTAMTYVPPVSGILETGEYYTDVLFDIPGNWFFEGIGTGAIIATALANVSVLPGL